MTETTLAQAPAAPTRGEPAVRTSLDAGVLLVTLNRPQQLNALTPAMWQLYAETLLAADEDDQVDAIVVTGAGRGFCAGVDSAVLQSYVDKCGRQEESPYRYHLATQLRKPVLAAINGACIGAGLSLAVMCDLRFAARSARVGAGFPRLGLPAEHGSAWVLQRLGGYAAAFELLGTGKLYAGPDLLRLGVVNGVVDDEVLLDHTMAFARDIVQDCSRRSVAMIKRQLQCGFDSTLAEAEAQASRLAARALAGPDFREAMASRASQRKPSFSRLRGDWWP